MKPVKTILKSVARPFISLYRDVVMGRRQDDLTFWILTSFLITFTLSRWTVRLFPELFLNVVGTHIHHFTYGFIILAATGFIGVTGSLHRNRWLAIVYGIGLSLAVDETGMWLSLTDHYYNDVSYHAIIFVVTLLVSAVYFRHFWAAVIRWIFRRRS